MTEKLPETFIVTCRILGKSEADLELPAELTIKDIKPKIIDIFRLDWHDCRILFKNHYLKDTDTLSTVGIYDGSILTVSSCEH